MSDAHAFAVGQLRAFIERVERVEEEIKTLNDDKSDIYKEIRSTGFDVKTVRKVVAKRKLADDVRDEQDSLFDTYWHALTGSTLVHVHTRENIEENPRSDGGAVAAVKGKARLANAAGVEPPPSERIDPETGEITKSATNEGGATETNPEAGQGAGNSLLSEPSGPEAERATHSPETANETMGGTGDDCSFGNSGEWPPSRRCEQQPRVERHQR